MPGPPSSSAMTGRPSYDYWALRSNGDFYLLQSLFEDDRAEILVPGWLTLAARFRGAAPGLYRALARRFD